MNKSRHITGKLLYGLLFLVIIPLTLWSWTESTESLVRYPPVKSTTAGVIFAVAGGLLMFWGMVALITYGKGLPMNVFPPSQFVTKGPYRFFQHPIYWGFGILLIGIFILEGSASGLWLVTPVTMLCMVALILGYEKQDLGERFPGETVKTVFHLPENIPEAATLKDQLFSASLVIVLLILGNYPVVTLCGHLQPLIGKPLNIGPVFENPYLQLISLAGMISVPFLLKKKDVLFDWVVSAILALALSTFIALIIPTVGAQYFLFGTSPSYTGSEGILTFLTVPVFLILISLKPMFRQSRRLFFIACVIAPLLIVIQLINSSSVIQLGTSIFIFLIATNYSRIWFLLKNLSEKIANSWQEWTFGKVRVINHGFYVGFSVFISIFYAGTLSGKLYAWAILVSALSGIVFAALWAQIIEGSDKLKRPFGYYGCLASIPFSCLAVWAMGINVWVIIAVGSVIMPWAQAIGRLRCLVNGCCHGGVVNNPKLGIRYFHVRSRVCGISGMKGELLHPTQLYAFLWLFLVGFILLALWINRFTPSFIFGLYLMLTGIGRFVEEAYRGEVQTKIVRGLRLYQWIAVLTVVIGMIMTMVPTEYVPVAAGLNWETLVAALIGGIFAWFAMGVDFPYSNKRFSRLV